MTHLLKNNTPPNNATSYEPMGGHFFQTTTQDIQTTPKDGTMPRNRWSAQNKLNGIFGSSLSHIAFSEHYFLFFSFLLIFSSLRGFVCIFVISGFVLMEFLYVQTCVSLYLYVLLFLLVICCFILFWFIHFFRCPFVF